MSRRIYKKLLLSCWDCPGRNQHILKMDDGIITGSGYCDEYEQEIPMEHLLIRTRFNNFPKFCKLKEER